MEAVRLIGELKLKLATLEIARRLATAAPVVQEEMCIALGNLGEKRAIPDLTLLLDTKKSFWKRTSGTPDAVRIRAIWALGQLLPDETASRCLTKAAKDSNPMVQRAAQSALTKK